LSFSSYADWNSSSKPAEQDSDASEHNKAEAIFEMVFVAHDDAAQVLQPGEEALDFPPAAGASQFAPVQFP